MKVKVNRITTFWVFALVMFMANIAMGQNQTDAQAQSVQELQQMVDNLKADNPTSPQLAKLEQKLSEAQQTAKAPTPQQLQQAIQGYKDRLTYLEERQKANPANTAITKRIDEIKAQMGKLQAQKEGHSGQ